MPSLQAPLVSTLTFSTLRPLLRRLPWLPVCASVFLLACQSTPPGTRAPIESPGHAGDTVYTPVPDNPAVRDGSPPSTPPAVDERPEPARPTAPQAALGAIEDEAEYYLQQQDWRKAIEVAERGLRIDRRHAEFYRILGVSYYQLGDQPQAQRFAQQARRFCRQQCQQVEALEQQLQP